MPTAAQLNKAMDLAAPLLTEDRMLAEAFTALADGRANFLSFYGDTFDTYDWLLGVADEAMVAQHACHFAGLLNLAALCEKIDLRIRKALKEGRKDAKAALVEVDALTEQAEQEMENVEAVAGVGL